MAKGRKVLPKEIKELQGTLRPGREQSSPIVYTKVNQVTEAPKELNRDEKKMYLSICEDLILAGILESPDLDTVLKLVMENSKYYHAMKEMRKKNSFVIIDPRSGKKVVNPLNTVANQALRAINSLSAELGLTPAARQRLKITKGEGEGDSDDPEKEMKGLIG